MLWCALKPPVQAERRNWATVHFNKQVACPSLVMTAQAFSLQQLQTGGQLFCSSSVFLLYFHSRSLTFLSLVGHPSLCSALLACFHLYINYLQCPTHHIILLICSPPLASCPPTASLFLSCSFHTNTIIISPWAPHRFLFPLCTASHLLPPLFLCCPPPVNKHPFLPSVSPS